MQKKIFCFLSGIGRILRLLCLHPILDIWHVGGKGLFAAAKNVASTNNSNGGVDLHRAAKQHCKALPLASLST